MSFKEDKYGDIYIDPHILKLRGGNEIVAFVETFFNEAQLTFALLELVLLKEQGIGETYIFAQKDFNADAFHQQYEELITDFKRNYHGGISSFKEWYSRNPWTALGKGRGKKESYNALLYDWHPKYKPRELNQYGNCNELPEQFGSYDDFFSEYLNKYEEAVLLTPFGNHPYYSIIVMPLPYLDYPTYDIKPLGNLYLHFCTNNEVKDDLLREFRTKFLSLWNKHYGGLLIEEAKKRLAASLLSDENITHYKPPIHMKKDEAKVYACYKMFFSDKENIEQLKEETEYVETYMLSKLNFIGENPGTNSKLDPKYRDAPKLQQIIANYNSNAFLIYLIRRKIAFYCFLSLQMDCREVHSLLVHGNLKQSNKTKGPNTIYNWFLYTLNLSLPETIETKELKSEVAKSLSNNEAEFISTYYNLFETTV